MLINLFHQLVLNQRGSGDIVGRDVTAVIALGFGTTLANFGPIQNREKSVPRAGLLRHLRP